jgi:hypothetical protein
VVDFFELLLQRGDLGFQRLLFVAADVGFSKSPIQLSYL